MADETLTGDRLGGTRAGGDDRHGCEGGIALGRITRLSEVDSLLWLGPTPFVVPTALWARLSLRTGMEALVEYDTEDERRIVTAVRVPSWPVPDSPDLRVYR